MPRREFFSKGGWRDYRPAAIYSTNEFNKWDCKKAGMIDLPKGVKC
jgi:hypothetical protein